MLCFHLIGEDKEKDEEGYVMKFSMLSFYIIMLLDCVWNYYAFGLCINLMYIWSLISTFGLCKTTYEI